MKLVAKEPAHSMGQDRPGTIKHIYEDNRKYYIKIFDSSPHKPSEYSIEITENDFKKISLNWEQHKRVSIGNLKGDIKKGTMKPQAGYKILPNIEIYTGHIDIKI